MGLLVPELIISGITLSNVYISINERVLSLSVSRESNAAVVSGNYSISKDRDSVPVATTHFSLLMTDHTIPVFQQVYTYFKSLFPDAIDIVEEKNTRNLVYDEEIGGLVEKPL